jgi:glycosyltransferase involved in cell wall biosynthesis
MVKMGEAVTIVIPLLSDKAALPRLLRVLSILDPPPAEIIAVDGGSPDTTVALARESGLIRVVGHTVRGRAAPINRGVTEARAPLVCVLHADTILPDDAVVVIPKTLSDPCIALGGGKWGSGRR